MYINVEKIFWNILDINMIIDWEKFKQITELKSSYI